MKKHYDYVPYETWGW